MFIRLFVVLNNSHSHKASCSNRYKNYCIWKYLVCFIYFDVGTLWLWLVLKDLFCWLRYPWLLYNFLSIPVVIYQWLKFSTITVTNCVCVRASISCTNFEGSLQPLHLPLYRIMKQSAHSIFCSLNQWSFFWIHNILITNTVHFNVYYVLSSQNSSYTLNCILLVMYIHVMDLITADKMEHTKISFEYYSPALTHVLSPSSILPPNSCRSSFIPRKKYFACLSKMWFFKFIQKLHNARNFLKSGSAHGLRNTIH